METNKASGTNVYTFDCVCYHFHYYIFYCFEVCDFDFYLVIGGDNAKADGSDIGHFFDIGYFYQRYNPDGIHWVCDEWGLSHEFQCGRRHASLSEAVVSGPLKRARRS